MHSLPRPSCRLEVIEVIDEKCPVRVQKTTWDDTSLQACRGVCSDRARLALCLTCSEYFRRVALGVESLNFGPKTSPLSRWLVPSPNVLVFFLLSSGGPNLISLCKRKRKSSGVLRQPPLAGRFKEKGLKRYLWAWWAGTATREPPSAGEPRGAWVRESSPASPVRTLALEGAEQARGAAPRLEKKERGGG